MNYTIHPVTMPGLPTSKESRAAFTHIVIGPSRCMAGEAFWYAKSEAEAMVLAESLERGEFPDFEESWKPGEQERVNRVYAKKGV